MESNLNSWLELTFRVKIEVANWLTNIFETEIFYHSRRCSRSTWHYLSLVFFICSKAWKSKNRSYISDWASVQCRSMKLYGIPFPLSSQLSYILIITWILFVISKFGTPNNRRFKRFEVPRSTGELLAPLLLLSSTYSWHKTHVKLSKE